MKPLPLLLAVALLAPSALAKDPPASGKAVAEYEAVEKAVLEHVSTVGAEAAAVAVSKDGKLLLSRGYGYADRAKKTPTPPDALFRIASCSKPITATLIKNAVHDEKLTLDAKAFDLLGLKPSKKGDAKLADITVQHLLDHKGGWDRDAAFDPMFKVPDIEKELGKRPATPALVVEYMLSRPLQFTPGEKTAYSNFGYCVLGRVVEKATKKTYAEALEASLCKPLGTKDIRVGQQAAKKRDAREVSYPPAGEEVAVDVLDACGGLVASAPALCTFMDAYWINGDPRKGNEWGDWTFFGSLPGTGSMIRQRKDGYNVAVLWNNRREKSFKEDNEALKKAVDAALDEVKK